MNLEKKLEMFAKASESAAKQKRHEIQTEIDRRLRQAVEKAKQEALESAEQKLELELRKLKQAEKRELANHKNEARKQAILLRENYLAELKNEICKSVEEYCTSDEYLEWLWENIEKELERNPDATIVLRQSDYDYLELEKTMASSGIALGGYKVVHGSMSIDYTFETKLDEQMEVFQGFGIIVA